MKTFLWAVYGIVITWMGNEMKHIDFFVEDQSGKIMLKHLIPKMLDGIDCVTFQIYCYKGIGHISKKQKSAKTIKARQLMDNLPKIINGCGNTYNNWPKNYKGYVIIVCDLDKQNKKSFLEKLNALLESCHNKPQVFFCLAIEEGEAWLLGDHQAVITAFPHANQKLLDSYKQDSICDTWETLANIVGFIYKGKSFAEIGKEKYRWADSISPHIVLERNQSPSFQHLLATVKAIV